MFTPGLRNARPVGQKVPLFQTDHRPWKTRLPIHVLHTFFALIVLAMVTGSRPTHAVQAEFDFGQELFRQLDGDGNNELTPYEAMDRLLQLKEELDGQIIDQDTLKSLLKNQANDEREEISEFLSELDKNSDGITTLAEMDDQTRQYAQLMDKNSDGIITLQEAMSTSFDDEMFLSSEEIQEEVDLIFRELDSNKNDVLEASEGDEEFSWEQISEGDSNRDGQVTRAELSEFLKSDNQRAEFSVEGDIAKMKGVINAETPAKVLQLIFEHPNVRTIVLENVPGSIDDESNLRAARYVRKFGFTTVIRANGSVASGGTDFFLAGRKRVVEPGGRLGIHSWGGPGYQGKDVPKDDPQHQLYLKYYEEMEIPGEFYWRTLEAAPANDIHWMTEEEIRQFKVRNPPKTE